MLDKQHRAYQSVVNYKVRNVRAVIIMFRGHFLPFLLYKFQVALVMAGFSKKEPYFVPRALLKLPFPVETCIAYLLPNYGVWCVQQFSPMGDKSETCQKFLNRIIPFLVEVLVQDGIYLIRDFPKHPMSLYLKVSRKQKNNFSIYFMRTPKNLFF